VSFSFSQNQVYIASWMENEVTVVDASTNKVVEHIPTGKESRAFGSFILENR
jgi:YVTN family beta-propeller protein